MNQPGAAVAGFHSTQWSVVLASRPDSAARNAAFAQLCRLYWSPIYTFLRRGNHSPADAEDLTQGFFLHVLASGFLARPDPVQGKFRSYLLGALQQFVGHAREHASAQKRGGGVTFLPLNHPAAESEFIATDEPELDPAEAYDRSWALTVMSQALQHLETEQAAVGRTRFFVALRPFLNANPNRGDYERCATALGTTRANVAVWIHRLNQRFAELIKLEVASTLTNPDEVDSELRHLLRALRR